MAGTEGGVFNYDGYTWYDYSDGLLSSNVRALSEQIGSCPTLFAGTAGGGVWEWPYPVDVSDFAPGIYLIRLSTQSEVVMSRFVKY